MRQKCFDLLIILRVLDSKQVKRRRVRKHVCCAGLIEQQMYHTKIKSMSFLNNSYMYC